MTTHFIFEHMPLFVIRFPELFVGRSPAGCTQALRAFVSHLTLLGNNTLSTDYIAFLWSNALLAQSVRQPTCT
jgi:hypothetical protein